MATRNIRIKLVRQLLILIACLIGLPLLGAALAGHDLTQYLQFPPQTRYVEHAPFSLIAFVLISLAEVLAIVAIITLLSPQKIEKSPHASKYVFPSWGWGSIVMNLSFWIMSWSRFDWCKPWQPFFFTCLWLSYIMFTNAITYWRTGSCYVTHHRRGLLVLFPASALFWWYFEYLNRFVQNWYYVGIDELSPTGYALMSTLAFSTVLPAVHSTLQLLKSFPQLRCLRLDFRLAIHLATPHAWMMLVVASLGLMIIPIWPDFTFPLIWLVPICVFPLLILNNQQTILSGLQGDGWNSAILSMFSALLCGFFWEMWNYRSEPKWIYSIPFVNSFHVFEMPLLGYFGYLPFGLACLFFSDIVKHIFCRGKNGPIYQ